MRLALLPFILFVGCATHPQPAVPPQTKQAKHAQLAKQVKQAEPQAEPQDEPHDEQALEEDYSSAQERAERKRQGDALVEALRQSHAARRGHLDANDREWAEQQAERRAREAELRAKMAELEALRAEAERQAAIARLEAAEKLADAVLQALRDARAAETLTTLESLRQQVFALQGQLNEATRPRYSWER